MDITTCHVKFSETSLAGKWGSFSCFDPNRLSFQPTVSFVIFTKKNSCLTFLVLSKLFPKVTTVPFGHFWSSLIGLTRSK